MTITLLVPVKNIGGEPVWINPLQVAAVEYCDLEEEVHVYLTGVTNPIRVSSRNRKYLISAIDDKLRMMVPR